MENLKSHPSLGPILNWAVVAEEKHEDGSPHLHCLVILHSKFSTRLAKFADSVGKQHGNYQPARNMYNCLKYVTKGGNYLAHNVDVDLLIRRQGSSLSSVAHMVKSGSTLEQINQEFPQVVMMHFQKIANYSAWMNLLDLRKNLLPWNGVVADPTAPLATREIVEWINLNVKKTRSFKQAQLMVIGPPNMGKTGLIELLSASLSIFYIPTEEAFLNDYDDKLYDLAVLDEFKGQKKIQWLNQWLQGSPMSIPKKGAQYLKRFNIPTIILSNFDLPDIYKRANYESLQARLLLVYVNEFIKIQLV